MKYKPTLIALALLAGVGLGLVVSPEVSANAGTVIMEGAGNTGDAANGPSVEDAIAAVANILLFLVGAIAVIMIIIGGLRYVTSQGDSGAMQSAKNTILYAIIGVIVAIIAYAIVNLIVDVMTG